MSAAGVFNALMMSISRLSFLLAEDHYLPSVITRRHPTTRAPWFAIVLCASIYSFFTLSAFASLVVDVIPYSAALLLEFAALISLRVKEPDMKRPVRVPGGIPGIVVVTLLPLGVIVLAIVSTVQEEGLKAVWMSAIALMTGPLIYPFLVRYVKKGRPSREVPIERVTCDGPRPAVGA